MNECVVLGLRKKSNIILAKNRDRAYIPTLYIIRTIVNNIEVVFLYDKQTGWLEGINENGLGIINTALIIGRDENEKKLVMKTGQKSKDGIKIFKALSAPSYSKAINILKSFKGGVKGHTLVGDRQGRLYTIESTSKNDPIITKINSSIVVRTNHGHHLQGAGYTKGDDYVSSKLRKHQVEKNAEDLHSVWDILSKSNFPTGHKFSPIRDVKLVTTSQMYLNLSKLELHLRIIKADFRGVKDYKLPENYSPKIKILIDEA